MAPDSAELAKWLAEAEQSLDEGDDARQVWSFPTDELLEEFLSTVQHRSEDDVLMLLRRLLIPSCALGRDHDALERYVQIRDEGGEDNAEQLRSFDNNHFKRVVRYYSGETDQLPWEGITWVLDLLPSKPGLALHAINTWFHGHMYMGDSMIHALSDAEALIRARFIEVPTSVTIRKDMLHDLSARDFERIVDRLYQAMGYDTELTPAQRDGGRDIQATKIGPVEHEYIYVECKRHDSNVGVKYVRQLLGVISTDRVNKGALVTTAEFTADAKAYAQRDRRIQLIGGTALVTALNENLGLDWPARLVALSSEWRGVQPGSRES
jgi:restriction system protein